MIMINNFEASSAGHTGFPDDDDWEIKKTGIPIRELINRIAHQEQIRRWKTEIKN